MNPNMKRLRRSMMFLNCQKPGLIKDPYVYQPDSIMLDLEDAVADREMDAARYSLFHALRTIDYRGVERVVRSAAGCAFCVLAAVGGDVICLLTGSVAGELPGLALLIAAAILASAVTRRFSRLSKEMMVQKEDKP